MNKTIWFLGILGTVVASFYFGQYWAVRQHVEMAKVLNKTDAEEKQLQEITWGGRNYLIFRKYKVCQPNENLHVKLDCQLK